MNIEESSSKTISIAAALPLTSGGMVLVKDYMWFSATCFNGLCRLDPQTGETVLMGCFPDEKWDAIYLHSQVGYYGNKLVFAPNRSKCIDVYDIEQNQFERILLPHSRMEMWSSDATKTYAMQQWKHRFVFCGLFLPIVIYFDTMSGEINFVQNMYERLYGALYDRKFPLFRKSSCSVRENAYVLCAQSNHIMRINMADDFYELFQTPFKFDTICYDGEFFWVSIGNELYIVKDFKLNKIISFDGEDNFVLGRCEGNYIYYISNQRDEITVVNKNYPYMVTKVPIKLKQDLFWVDDGSIRIFGGTYKAGQEEIALLCDKSSTIFFLKDGKVRRKISPFLKQGTPELIEMSKEILLKWDEFDNVHENNLRLWLCRVSICDGNSNLKKAYKTCVGDRIYQAVTMGKDNEKEWVL